MAALADSSAPFYERSFALAADAKCGLFAPVVTSALTTSTLQARGVAARAGMSDIDIRATADRARSRAARTACSDPQLATVRGRVATAFAGWAGTARMTFPGGPAGWSANRSDFARPTWRLMQASMTGASPVSFGFSGGGGQAVRLKAVVSFVGRPRPYGARIVMRDAEHAPRPWLTTAGAALPPEPSRRAFFASSSAAAEETLLAAEQTQGQAWIFPATAAAALERLDPREPFLIEFLFRDGSVATARFEAGDFAAGRAFIGMGTL